MRRCLGLLDAQAISPSGITHLRVFCKGGYPALLRLLMPATYLACSLRIVGIQPLAFLAQPFAFKSAKQRAIEKNPVGIRRLGIVLVGPFDIFFQETAPLHTSTKNLLLIHASSPFGSNIEAMSYAHITLINSDFPCHDIA